ncbi:uncharacterized protein J3D65DRAFT_140167 [Phyllosticta citribraziliensis]|uniref:DUF4112 domain-containing protein n=1 Tax=Phyllosticta citribraziliensis TaxID=989973 RepID=A0ABR1L8Z1_9PEZI
MTTAIGKYAFKRVVTQKTKNSKNQRDPYEEWDPYYEWVRDPKSGKHKKVKKDVASYIPEHDAAILRKVRKRARLLDSCFNLGITRAGLSSIIGLVPGVGDVSDVLLAMYIWNMCAKVDGGLSGSEHMKMAQNIAIDGAIGLVPIIGDIADTAFKANIRNLKVLEKHLEKKYGATAKSKRHQRSAGDDYYSDDDAASTPPRRHDRRGRRYDSLDYDRSRPTSRDITRRGDVDRRDRYADEELGRRDTQRSSRRRGY